MARPLSRATGEKLPLSGFDYSTGRHLGFFVNKSRVVDGPAGGKVLKIAENSLFLFGIRDDLVNMAIQQDFGQVLQYKAEVGSVFKTVEYIFTEDSFRKMSLAPGILEASEVKDGLVTFRLEGQLHYSQEGLVFGVLPSENLLPLETR